VVAERGRDVTTRRIRWRPWLLGWLGMVVLALLNGTLRAVVIQPWLGEEVARRLATVSLLALLADYDLTRGRIWVLVPLWTTAVVAAVHRVRAARGSAVGRTSAGTDVVPADGRDSAPA
jgi:hypothetical protein